MKSPWVVGIDIGGTFVKYGLVRGARILTEGKVPTASLGAKPKAFVEGLVKLVRSLEQASGAEVRAVGIGVPGLVRYPQGVVRACANLPDWKNVPLRGLLHRKLHLPVGVDNDVNLMTLAEWKVGAGRGVKSLVCLTLGTGVGGGLVLDGRIYRGAEGWAGELGHMPVAESGPRCVCGGIACLERTVGNREILQWIRGRLNAGASSRIRKLVGGDLRRITPEVIDRACALGDPLARAAWKRVGTHVGLVLAGVVNLLNPERIVIGGGISKAGRWLFEPLRQTVRRRAMRGPGEVSILPARLGSSAGLIGAALLAQEGVWSRV